MSIYGYDINDLHIINVVENWKKPIIERYNKLQKTMDDIIMNSDNVISYEQDFEDVAYDFDFLVTFENNDNIYEDIQKLKKTIETKTVLYVKLLDEQIEDAMLAEAEEEIVIDYYCNIICRR